MISYPYQATEVRLDQIFIDRTRLTERELALLSETALLALMYAMPFERRPAPVVGWMRGDVFELLFGHRRVLALRMLAAKNVPDYVPTMAVEARILEPVINCFHLEDPVPNWEHPSPIGRSVLQLESH